jgi:primosomal protein N' (replication factor Y)
LCALGSGTAFAQTWNPDHRVFADIQKLDLDTFYEAELKERRDLSLPPFAHLISVVCRSADAKRASAQIEDIHVRLSELNHQGLEVHETQEDFRSKLRDQYRFIIILKSTAAERDVAAVRKILKSVKRKAGVTTTVQVDP